MVLLPGCGCCGGDDCGFECPGKNDPTTEYPRTVRWDMIPSRQVFSDVVCRNFEDGRPGAIGSAPYLLNCPTSEQLIEEFGQDKTNTSVGPFEYYQTHASGGFQTRADYTLLDSHSLLTVEYYQFQSGYCITPGFTAPTQFFPQGDLYEIRPPIADSCIKLNPSIDVDLPSERGPWFPVNTDVRLQYSILANYDDPQLMDNYQCWLDGTYVVNQCLAIFNIVMNGTYENAKGDRVLAVPMFYANGSVQNDPENKIYCI